MLSPLPGVELNLLELAMAAVLLILALPRLLGLCARSHERWIVALAMAGSTLLTAIEATQFMTIDELGITARLLEPRSRAIDQLELGAFKTGAVFALLFVLPMQALAVDPTTIRMMLKVAWWLSGNLIVLAIACRCWRQLRHPWRQLWCFGLLLRTQAVIGCR